MKCHTQTDLVERDELNHREVMRAKKFYRRIGRRLRKLYRRIPKSIASSAYLFKHGPKDLHAWRGSSRATLKDVRSFRLLVPPEALEKKYREALHLLMEQNDPEAIGDYLEFGVGAGTSMACMYRTLKTLKLQHVRLFGFDSFEGLPEVARTDTPGVWSPGAFSYSLGYVKKLLAWQGVDEKQIHLIQGWFSNTLNAQTRRRYGIAKASVIMIDCDLYASTKEALNFCEPLIGKTAVMLFDDWHAGNLAAKNMGEKRAFDEFLQENPHLTTEPIGGYNKNSEAFLIKRTSAPLAASKGSRLASLQASSPA